MFSNLLQALYNIVKTVAMPHLAASRLPFNMSQIYNIFAHRAVLVFFYNNFKTVNQEEVQCPIPSWIMPGFFSYTPFWAGVRKWLIRRSQAENLSTGDFYSVRYAPFMDSE